MKYLVYTDLQATESGSRCHANPALPLQRYRVAKFFEFLSETFKKHKCDALVDLGDTTDDRSFIYRATLDTLLGGLAQFAPNKNGIKLTGNHEQLLKMTDINSKWLYQPYFGRIDPTVVTLRNTTIVCQPYHEDYDQINESIAARLAEIPEGHTKILLAHCDVVGVKYDSGESIKKGVLQTLVDQFDHALFGHIHRSQKIGRSSHYVGSPFQQDFGEANQNKFVCILDTDNSPAITWIPVTGMPEYRVLDLETFLKTASHKEEHRYWVILKSIAETEQFYSSPLSVLGEPKMSYTTALTEERKNEIQEMKMDNRQLLERYVVQRPISGVPADLDLVEIGEMLIKS